MLRLHHWPASTGQASAAPRATPSPQQPRPPDWRWATCPQPHLRAAVGSPVFYSSPYFSGACSVTCPLCLKGRKWGTRSVSPAHAPSPFPPSWLAGRCFLFFPFLAGKGIPLLPLCFLTPLPKRICEAKTNKPKKQKTKKPSFIIANSFPVTNFVHLSFLWYVNIASPPKKKSEKKIQVKHEL